MIKINPFLVFKPDTTNGLVMLNYFTKKYYKLDKKDLDFVFKVFKDVAKGKKIEMTDDIKFLFKNNFLIKENSDEYKLYRDAKIWEEYGNSDSIFYHVFTYNYPFLDYRDDQSMTIDSYMMANYKNKNEHPSFYKIYPNSKKIDLINPEKDFSVNPIDVFNDVQIKPLTSNLQQLLSTFLYLSYGKTNPEIEFIRKTIPSGGGKHPTEVYLVFPNDHFIKSGVYHYNVLEHKLDLIKEGNYWDKVMKGTNKAIDVENENKFCVIYTSLVERAMWRYRDIRSTRAYMADLGHVIQGSEWNANALGMGYEVAYNLQENQLAELLDVDDELEVILASNTFYIKNI